MLSTIIKYSLSHFNNDVNLNNVRERAKMIEVNFQEVECEAGKQLRHQFPVSDMTRSGE